MQDDPDHHGSYAPVFIPTNRTLGPVGVGLLKVRAVGTGFEILRTCLAALYPRLSDACCTLPAPGPTV